MTSAHASQNTIHANLSRGRTLSITMTLGCGAMPRSRQRVANMLSCAFLSLLVCHALTRRQFADSVQHGSASAQLAGQRPSFHVSGALRASQFQDKTSFHTLPFVQTSTTGVVSCIAYSRLQG